MFKAILLGAVCLVGSLAANDATITYYNNTGCSTSNNGDTSTVNVSPNQCQIQRGERRASSTGSGMVLIVWWCALVI